MKKIPGLRRTRARVKSLSRRGETSITYDAVLAMSNGEPIEVHFSVADFHRPLEVDDRVYLKYTRRQGDAPHVWFLRRGRQILVDHLGVQSRRISLWVTLGFVVFFALTLYFLRLFLTSNMANMPTQ